MATDTKIQWATHTASPFYGCQHATLPDGSPHPGCLHCYAESGAKRSPATLGEWGPGGTRVVSQSFHAACRGWNKAAERAGQRATVFPSLCDPFEDFDGWVLDNNGRVQWACRDCGAIETVGGDGHGNCCGSCGSGHGRPATLDDLRRDLFATIDACPWLDFLLLTKRPENVRRMWLNGFGVQNPAYSYRKNVWLIASVSDQTTADAMIPPLLSCRDLVPVLGLSCLGRLIWRR